MPCHVGNPETDRNGMIPDQRKWSLRDTATNWNKFGAGWDQFAWQAQHFRKTRRRFRGRRSTFALQGTGFAKGAALSQGQVEIT